MKYIKTILILGLLGFNHFAISQCADVNACNYNQNTADEICLSVETVLTHTTGDLNGQTTYRLYVNFPADKSYYMVAVAGATTPNPAANILPTNISTTTNFYHDAAGATFGDELIPAMWATFPNGNYDSWVTIIAEDDTGVNVESLGDWVSTFAAGGNIDINDTNGGIWYINGQNPSFNGNSIGGPGAKVLIGQFTTDGTLSADISIEYFEKVGNETIVSFSNLSTDNSCVFGNCVYPPTNLDCNFNCINDTDNDGICDEFEVAGCTDLSACNYNAKATDTDPTLCDFSCVGASFQSGSCDGEVTITYHEVIYDLIEIDGRCWFAEDLRTLTDVNGNTIQAVTEPETWSGLTVNDGGKLTYLADGGIGQDYVSYNWYAVNSGLLCPSGWHVANNLDWNSLEAQAFGVRAHRLSKKTQIVAGSAQELYDLGWFGQYANGAIFDQFLFSGGLRENVNGLWRDADGSIYWWTAEEYTPKSNEIGRRANSAWARGLKSQGIWGRYNDLWSTSNSKENALRVRCVKNETP
jgi:uncharacterized protein (TIGR02145 family)